MPCKRVSLHRGPCWGTWRGFFLRDFLRDKKKNIRVPFLDPEDFKILSLGAIWNFAKGTGLS